VSGSVGAIVAIAALFFLMLLIRVAFLLVLRSGETKPKSPTGPGPRIILTKRPDNLNTHDFQPHDD
jgi:hypothetical protein